MRCVGLTIKDATGHEDALIRFIKENCILENPQVAYNIAYKTKGVNVYPGGEVSVGDFNASFNNSFNIDGGLGFPATPILYEPSSEILIVSIVNFMLEFRFHGETIRLMPTEYLRGVPEDAQTTAIRELVKRGCVRVYS